MFPIPFNFPFRKNDGAITTIGDAISSGGGGGYTLPTASASVKGGVKVGDGLTMDGEVLKTTGGGYTLPTASASVKGGVKVGAGLYMDGEVMTAVNPDPNIYETLSPTRPIFKPAETSGKYLAGVIMSAINAAISSANFDTTELNIDAVYLPEDYSNFEFYNYVTDGLISDLGLVLLGTNDGSGSTFTLSDTIDNYEAIVIQGLYNNTGTSGYDTTMIYVDMNENAPYWFGVKDRNASYSGNITISGTTATLSANRRVKVYGVPAT